MKCVTAALQLTSPSHSDCPIAYRGFIMHDGRAIEIIRARGFPSSLSFERNKVEVDFRWLFASQVPLVVSRGQFKVAAST